MPIPSFQAILRPWLVLASDGKEHGLQDVIAELGEVFSLTEAERAEMLPSGFQATFTNRVAWAATHLNRAGAINRVGRGRYVITDRGKQLLISAEPLTMSSLAKFPEYQAFKSRGKASSIAAESPTLECVTTPSPSPSTE